MSGGGSLWAWLGSFVQNLLGGRQADADLSRNVESYVELLIDEKIASGMTPAEARRAALVESGGVESAKEQARSARAGAWLSACWQDVRYAVRTTRRAPGFAAAAVLTLTLGIGANTAVFSVVDGVLLRDLPYGGTDRIVVFQNHDADGEEFGVSERERLLYGAESSIFEHFSTFQFGSGSVTGDGGAERLIAGIVDANMFDTLAVAPVRGRTFVQDDVGAGPTTVVILTHEFWTRRYGADESVIGQVLDLNARPREVIGVLPPGFRLPGDFLGEPVSLYVPLSLTGDPDPENIHYMTAVARLAPGLTFDEAAERTRAAAARVKAQISTLPETYSASLIPIERSVLGDLRPGLAAVSAAVGLLLLIACGNLASLLLAKGRTRRGELALRTALGAGRSRIVRQLLTESVFLAALGGLGGVVFAYVATRSLVALGPEMPRLDTVSVDGRVLLFTAGLSVVTGVVFGLLPAWTQARQGLLSAASRGARGSVDGRLPARRTLVVVQVALSVALAIGAGLLMRSAQQLAAVPPGFNPDGVLTMRVTLPSATYPDKTTTHRFFTELVDSVRAIPGVEAAGLTTHLPMANATGDWGLLIQGLPERLDNGRRPFADWMVVSDGYIESMGIPLVAGRTFTADDVPGTEPVVLINEEMARAYWPDRSPIGARMMMSSTIDPIYRTIVGVVADVHHRGLDQVPRRQMFLPDRQFPSSDAEPNRGMSLVVRTSGDVSQLAGPVRARVQALDAGVPAAQTRTMADILRASTSVSRVYLVLFGVFAAIALAIVCVGIYGVSSYLVATRRRELAIRRALGASTRSVVALVVREGLMVAVVGLAIGLAGSIALASLMGSLLFGVTARDPVTFATVPVVVIVAALVANLLPARRAASQDALHALRLD